jgi:hypothetical protein
MPRDYELTYGLINNSTNRNAALGSERTGVEFGFIEFWIRRQIPSVCPSLSSNGWISNPNGLAWFQSYGRWSGGGYRTPSNLFSWSIATITNYRLDRPSLSDKEMGYCGVWSEAFFNQRIIHCNEGTLNSCEGLTRGLPLLVSEASVKSYDRKRSVAEYFGRLAVGAVLIGCGTLLGYVGFEKTQSTVQGTLIVLIGCGIITLVPVMLLP